jgi:hypothetical protein
VRILLTFVTPVDHGMRVLGVRKADTVTECIGSRADLERRSSRDVIFSRRVLLDPS